MPKRDWRYLVGVDEQPSTVAAYYYYIWYYTSTGGRDRKVILSNVRDALCVYNKLELDCDLWDPQFQDAVVQTLKYRICLPVTGNAGMRGMFAQDVEKIITAARAVDGNEAIAKTDHVPDWIATRGAFSPHGYGPMFQEGFWNAQWDSMSWGA
jgi:hypothetical protein